MCDDKKTKMAKIDLEIEDSLLFEIMKKAHEADVTLNQYLQNLFEKYFDDIESKK